MFFLFLTNPLTQWNVKGGRVALVFVFVPLALGTAPFTGLRNACGIQLTGLEEEEREGKGRRGKRRSWADERDEERGRGKEEERMGKAQDFGACVCIHI